MNSPNPPHPEPDTEQETAESLGALLARTRIEHGLEQREAATRLGLTTETIRALESGDFHSEAPVFVRGYLTRYARLLSLPEQDIVGRFKRLGIVEQPPLRIAPTVKPRSGMSALSRWASYLIILGLVGWLGWLGFEQMAERFGGDTLAQPDAEGNAPLALPQPPPEPPPVITPEQSPPAQAAAEQPPAGAGDSTPSAASPPEQSAAATPEEPAPVAEPETEPETVSLASVTPENPASDDGKATLSMQFAEDCWVNIRDASGERIAYGTMKGDTASTFTGTPPFTVVLGNSGAVTVELNGKTIPREQYFKRGGVSRFVLEPEPSAAPEPAEVARP